MSASTEATNKYYMRVNEMNQLQLVLLQLKNENRFNKYMDMPYLTSTNSQYIVQTTTARGCF